MVLNIQKQMQELFGHSCYCYCLAKYFSGIKDIKGLTKLVLEGWISGYIEDDGYVAKPLKFIELIKGQQFRDVEKVPISKLSDIPSESTIVEMLQPNGKDSHFCICHFDGTEVILDFDPAGISNSWKGQNFVSYRKFVK